MRCMPSHWPCQVVVSLFRSCLGNYSKKHVYMMTLLEIHDFLPFFFTALSSSSHQHDLIYISQWINLKLYMYLIIYLSRDYLHLHYVVCSFTLFVILLLEFALYP